LARHGKKNIRFGSKGKKIEDFVDPNKDPHSYLKRFILEENYRDWFNRNYPDSTIYDAVGLNEWDYNEMKKKLSPEQDTVEETSEPEPEPEPEREPESKDDGKISGKWTSEPSGTERTRPKPRFFFNPEPEHEPEPEPEHEPEPESKHETRDKQVLLSFLSSGTLKRGAKNFEDVQKITGLERGELVSILKDLEDRRLIKVEEKSGLFSHKVELYITDKGLKKILTS